MTDSGLRIWVNAGTLPIGSPDVLERAVEHTLRAEGCSEGEVSLTLLDDDAIRAMNADYLGRDAPTDVISFSLGEDGELLGDVYVGVEQARRQADEWGVPLDEELARLAIHGTLHVLGYDHPEGTERNASAMFELQEAYLRAIVGGPGA